MKCGDICLAYFPFTDATGTKLRPVLIVSGDSFNVGEDVVVVPLSSRIDPHRGIVIDTESPHFAATGLRLPSTIRWAKPFTMSRRVISRRLGTLAPVALNGVLTRLRTMFGG
jgi:mRNA-degrading endonuclease toxin of MazEF toxin-antitoxin module